jgi:hypothetical protein
MTTDTTITPELLDQLLANYEKPEDLTGADGLFKQLKKALIERALGAELSEHLGYEKGDPAGRGSGNSRNSRALMFIALDKLNNQGLKQAIIVVPEKSIGASFHDEPLTKFGFWADWTVRRNGISATRPERTMEERSVRSALSSKVMTRCWSAPTQPSDSPWTSSGSRRSTTG